MSTVTLSIAGKQYKMAIVMIEMRGVDVVVVAWNAEVGMRVYGWIETTVR